MASLTALVTAALLAACGGEDGPEGVGEVVDVKRSLVLVDKKRAADGWVLQAGATLSTDERGIARFRLNTGLTDCETKKNSAVHVSPPGTGWLAVFLGGTTACNGREFKLGDAVAVKGHEVIPLDATFSVDVDGREFVVRVFRGFVEVQAAVQSRLIGPDSQVNVPEGQDVSSVRPTDTPELDERERETIDRLKAAFAEPQFGFPEPEDSPGLGRVDARRTLRVALDRGASGPSEQFLESFLDFLAEQWGVRVEITKRASATAGRDLRSGELDVLTSAAPVAGGRSVPFFADDTGRQWALQVSEADPKLESALLGFLKPALEIGEYGRRYRASFARLPDYEVVRSVIFSTPSVGSSPFGPPTGPPPGPSTTKPSGGAPSSTSPPPPAPPPPPSGTTPPPPPGRSVPAVRCEGKVATIVGTPGADTIQGTAGPDVIAGLGGDDEINGRDGDDTICGGDGVDRIHGDEGADTIFGNDGNDLLYGGPGDDKVFGNEGDDQRVDGSEGDDLLDGGIGNDIIHGNDGRDTMRGGDGDDTIVSNSSVDDGSPDVLDGDSGRDLLNASDGVSNDQLNGGSGSQDRCLVDPGEQTFDCES